jgi:MFS family permease
MSTTTADASVISVDYAIEQVGFGMFQYMVLLACALCNASDGMSVMLLSFLAPVLVVTWDLSTEEAARLTSMIFAGALLGTLVLGPLSDQYGRRPVFLLSASIVVCGGVLTALSPNYGTCMLTVFGLGTGIGGMSVPFDILAEFLPSGGRGTNLLRINYAWTIGTIYVVGMAFSFLQGYTPAWRLVTLLTVMPCSVSLMIGYWFVPESPHWLASKGRLREAMHVLRIAASSNGHDSVALFPDHVSLQPVWGEKHASVTDLFQPKWRELTLLLWGAWFTSAFGYYGTLLVTTRVFSYSDTTHHSGNVMDYNAIFVSSCAELVGTTVAIAVVDRIGRIQTQVLAFWMAGILLCLLCILAEWNAPRWALLILSFGARVFEMIGPSVIWISTAECLPTDIRGTGHSMAAALSRLGAFFCPFLIESRTPLIHVGAVMLVAHICTVCCVSRLPETTGRGMGSSSHIDADEKTVGESELLLLSMSTRSVK